MADKRREEEVILLIVLMIVGISFSVVRTITYHRRSGVCDYWLDLKERYEQAWPRIEFGDGNGSK